jgi:hypothetical protein
MSRKCKKEEFNANVFEFFKTPFNAVSGDDWWH